MYQLTLETLHQFGFCFAAMFICALVLLLLLILIAGQTRPACIGLSETWLDNSFMDSKIFISGYVYVGMTGTDKVEVCLRVCST